jgi:type I restriction enzyme R subunit
LQEAIRQIDTDNQSIVGTIDDKAIREYAGLKEENTASKSGRSGHAIESGKLIVVVTIQTFPFILSSSRTPRRSSKAKKFAVIADEAHSSQSGNTAAQLKSVLTAEQQEELD